ncbi:MAG TPA: flagellar protein FliT [Stenomitos sp.]
MNPGADLKALYQEALALSERQSKAIDRDDWAELQSLLEARDPLIQKAEQLLANPIQPTNKAELADLLRQLHQIDARNQVRMGQKQLALRAEMEGIGRSKVALNGYLESFGSAFDPTFFDQDR